jgi:hypothetical protein
MTRRADRRLALPGSDGRAAPRQPAAGRAVQTRSIAAYRQAAVAVDVGAVR